MTTLGELITCTALHPYNMTVAPFYVEPLMPLPQRRGYVTKNVTVPHVIWATRVDSVFTLDDLAVIVPMGPQPPEGYKPFGEVDHLYEICEKFVERQDFLDWRNDTMKNENAFADEDSIAQSWIGQ